MQIFVAHARMNSLTVIIYISGSVSIEQKEINFIVYCKYNLNFIQLKALRAYASPLCLQANCWKKFPYNSPALINSIMLIN